PPACAATPPQAVRSRPRSRPARSCRCRSSSTWATGSRWTRAPTATWSASARGSGPAAMDLERVEALLRVAHQADVAELRVEGDGWRVAIRKGAPPARAEPPAPPPVAVPVEAPPALLTVGAEL